MLEDNSRTNQGDEVKITLEFPPEEYDEAQLAITATKAKSALSEFVEESLRKRIKYSSELNESQAFLLRDIRNELFEFYKERNLESWLD